MNHHAGWVAFTRGGILALLAAALVQAGLENAGSAEKSVDEKIEFYRKHTGGPGTYPAWARLGRAYLEKFRETGTGKYYDQGLDCLRHSLRYQRNFEALLGMALGLSERHCFKEALPYAEEAVGAMPSDLEATGALFDIRLALGQVQHAETGLNAMLEAGSGFHALSRLAALREYRGDEAGALEAMLKARDDAARRLSAQTQAWAEVRVGSIYARRCESTNARAACERALKLVPGYFFATEHLAEWHAAQGRWSEAEKLFQQLAKSRSQPQYRLALEEVYHAQGRERSAAQENRKALAELRDAARDGAHDVFRPLALLLLEQGQNAAEGLRWAQKDWDVRQDALTAGTLAWALFRNGRTDEALQLSENALQSGNRDTSLLFQAGIIRVHAGRATEGIRLLNHALACPLAFGPVERRLAAEARKELDRAN